MRLRSAAQGRALAAYVQAARAGTGATEGVREEPEGHGQLEGTRPAWPCDRAAHLLQRGNPSLPVALLPTCVGRGYCLLRAPSQHACMLPLPG